MHELAECQGVQLERFWLQPDGPPSQRVAPHEAERITQQALEACCRLSRAQERPLSQDGLRRPIHHARYSSLLLPISPTQAALTDMREL